MIKTIKDNILNRLKTKLPTFSKMSFSYTIEDNKFNGNKKTYGVNSGSFSSVSGNLGGTTLDHTFRVILTDTFLSGAEGQLNDNTKSEKVVELQDLCLDVFNDFQANRQVLGSGILIVNNLSVGEPEFLEDESIVVLRMDFNIKYKV